MSHSRPRRLAACLAAAGALAAAGVPAAQAAVTADMNVGAELIEQPKGRPWAVNLLLGAQLTESSGNENLPITSKYAFTFPKAAVNAEKFAVCRATEGQLRTRGPAACPAATKIGEGTASARAIGLLFPATVQIFNGPGTRTKREIILWARASQAGIDVVVILRGTLTKVSRGDTGFTLDLPIPKIEVVQGQYISIEAFDVKVGKRIRRGGRTISYVDAPTKCGGRGWPFTFRVDLEGGLFASDAKAISCVIRAA